MLGLPGAALYFFVRHSIEARSIKDPPAKAHAVAATAEPTEPTIIFDYEPDEFQFVTSDHAVVSRTVALDRSESGAPLPLRWKQADAPPAQSPARSLSQHRYPDGSAAEIVSMSFTTTIEPNAGQNVQPETVHTVVVQRRNRHDCPSSPAGKLGLAAGGIVLACRRRIGNCFGLDRWPSGAAAERIARDIDGLQENDLSVRLHPPDVPLELQPVVEKLNGLLSRLDAAFSREKAFTADVAHSFARP